MSQLVSITSASLSHTPLRITLLLIMDKTYLLLILVLFLFHLLSLIFNLIMSLRVPPIASNLAFVHKLCHDNHYWCYFDENIISIQALDTGKILYQGKSEGAVYPFYPHHASQLLPLHRICNNVSRYSDFNKTFWHIRLGHHNDQALNCLFPNVKSVQNNVSLVTPTCTHCLYGKMHNISFPNSQVPFCITYSICVHQYLYSHYSYLVV